MKFFTHRVMLFIARPLAMLALVFSLGISFHAKADGNAEAGLAIASGAATTAWGAVDAFEYTGKCFSPTGAALDCVKMAASYVTIAGGIYMMASAQSTRNALSGSPGGIPQLPPLNMGAPLGPQIDSSICGGADASTALCSQGGLDEMLKNMGQIEDLIASGKVDFSGQDDLKKQFANSKKAMSALKAGDMAGFDAAMGEYGDSTNGDKSLSSGVADNSGSDSEYLGSGDTTTTGKGANLVSGGKGGKGGPQKAMLDKTQWNGMLSMIDPVTGNELTLWDRASRRYMGVPSMARFKMMTRIEAIRQAAGKASQIAKSGGTKNSQSTANSKNDRKPANAQRKVSAKGLQ